MQYNKLGTTDLSVSEICLGTMTFGEQNTEADAHEQLDYALDQGVNFIDAAEMYPVPPRPETQGLTESYIGTWLKARGNRDKVILATKATGPSDMTWIRNGPRLTKAHITEAIEDNLKRLQTDYIDLYQMHWPDRNANNFGQLGYVHKEDEQSTPIEETLDALQDLVKQGKVRHIGVSNETPWGLMSYLQLAKDKGFPRVQSIQNPYSLLNRSYEVGLAEVSLRENVGMLAYSPLAMGLLSGKYIENPPADARLSRFPRFTRYMGEEPKQPTKDYVAIAKKHHLDPAQMALAFVNSRPFVTSNIIGATTMEQLKSNIDSVNLLLSDDVVDEIEAVHKRYSNPCA